MVLIKNTDDFKKVEIFKVKAERCGIHDSNQSFLNLLILPFDFSEAEFNPSLLEFISDDIIGKTSQEFLGWLMEKSEEEGYDLESILEDDFSVSLGNCIFDKMFDFDSKKLIPDTNKLWNNESFYVEEDELSTNEPYFISFEEAKRFLKESYNFLNID